MLRRHLGLTSAVMITVGSVIGSGIFLKPLDIAKSLPDPATIYLFWIGIGVVCLCGALAYAELGAMLPEAGGQYTYLREAWGPLVAFLFGWCYFLVINTGTMSALGVAFTQSLERLLGRSFSEPVFLGLSSAMILVLAAVNHFGVRWGAALQNVTTFAKIGSLGLIAGAGFLFGEPGLRSESAVVAPATGITAAVAACIAIFWAYEGWHQLPFSAAELKRPRRDLPLGLILGVVILITLYVIVNSVYFWLVPIDEMRTLGKDIEVPTLAVDRISGGAGVGILSAMICLSVFGAANPNMLSSSRAFWAMSRDGLAPKGMTWLHSRWQTPVVSIWTQAIWAVALIVVLRTFRDLTDFVVYIALIFYALAVAAVYVLRRKRPDLDRPHRCLGYPITPAVFIAAVLFVDGWRLTDAENRQNALIGLGILLAGLPVYWWLHGRGSKTEETPRGG